MGRKILSIFTCMMMVFVMGITVFADPIPANQELLNPVIKVGGKEFKGIISGNEIVFFVTKDTALENVSLEYQLADGDVVENEAHKSGKIISLKTEVLVTVKNTNTNNTKNWRLRAVVASDAKDIIDPYIVTGDKTITGKITGKTITFDIPYGYSDERVFLHYQMSPGATVKNQEHKTGSQVSLKSELKVTIVAEDKSEQEWILKAAQQKLVQPTITLDSAEDITTTRATIPYRITPGTESFESVKLFYYTSNKSNAKSKNLYSNDEDYRLTGLSSNTRYRYYIQIKTVNNTYETSTKSFTTKSSSSSGGSSSGSTTYDPGLVYRNNKLSYVDFIKSSWVKTGNNWYYFDQNGYATNGWQFINGLWYYFMDYRMVSSDWVLSPASNRWYYFHSDGRMADTQWILYKNQWYYMNPGGPMVTNDWVYLNQKWYWLQSDGAMLQNNWLDYKGNRYWLNRDNGEMAVNTRINVNDVWYNIDANGYVSR